MTWASSRVGCTPSTPKHPPLGYLLRTHSPGSLETQTGVLGVLRGASGTGFQSSDSCHTSRAVVAPSCSTRTGSPWIASMSPVSLVQHGNWCGAQRHRVLCPGKPLACLANGMCPLLRPSRAPTHRASCWRPGAPPRAISPGSCLSHPRRQHAPTFGSKRWTPDE